MAISPAILGRLAQLTLETAVEGADLLVYGLFAAKALLGEHPESDHPVIAGEGGLGEAMVRVPDAVLARLHAGIDAISVRPTPSEILHGWSGFLHAVDPGRRKRGGVYTTPDPLADAMVARADRALREALGDGLVRGPCHILDPSVGTGVFLIAIAGFALDEWLRTGASATAWRRYVREDLVVRLHGIELDPAARGLARMALRFALARGLAEARGLDPKAWGVRLEAGVLDLRGADTLGLTPADFPPLQVIVGNPPYQRISEAEVRGGLIDDLLAEARAHTIFSHHASLYDRYVQFWRWALRQTFEAHDRPAVVCLVTNRAWLSGPGFVGLRKLARAHADRIAVEDLGGDGRGAGEDNPFGIGTPVAIVTLARGAAPAAVRYRRGIEVASPWQAVVGREGAALLPDPGDAVWSEFPPLEQLFPWRHPGCKVGRLWPISPDPEVLARRWRALLDGDASHRAAAFGTRTTGRTVHTRVRGHVPLVDLSVDAPVPPVVRYGYRSFDTQWILQDPRLAALERPPLWAVRGPRQVYFVAPMTKATSAGPCLIACAHLPDLDAFRGSFGGKDVLPLYRDAAGTEPNLADGLLDRLSEVLGAPVDAEEVAAVVLALLGGRPYQARFAEALARPGPRVPLPRDPGLWERAAALGRRLMDLHLDRVAPAEGPSWRAVPSGPPAAFRYDPAEGVLLIGDGRLEGVSAEAWAYAVSSMPVLKKWLGYRSLRGAGRAARSAEPLDAIRSTRWLPEWSEALVRLVCRLDAIVALEVEQVELLYAVLAGPRFDASDLPVPSPDQGRPP